MANGFGSLKTYRLQLDEPKHDGIPHPSEFDLKNTESPAAPPVSSTIDDPVEFLRSLVAQQAGQKAKMRMDVRTDELRLQERNVLEAKKLLLADVKWPAPVSKKIHELLVQKDRLHTQVLRALQHRNILAARCVAAFNEGETRHCDLDAIERLDRITTLSSRPIDEQLRAIVVDGRFDNYLQEFNKLLNLEIQALAPHFELQ